ncbi:MAG: response regulator transcription factor [Bacillota bacterium]|nr:response regulator transcription factor [Bacillota bacterium]
MAERILLVDPDEIMLKGLKFSLEQEGYTIETATDGKVAYEMILNGVYDLIVLELGLPNLSGFEICRKVRELSMTPIIFLTEKADDSSKVLGFEYGADDYVTKPFVMLELKARIKALFRRSRQPDTSNPSNIMKFGEIVVNTLGRKIQVRDKNVNLTAKEFDLLLLMILNAEKVFSREELLDAIWGYEYYSDVRTVDVHVRRLREKIEADSSKPEYIQTKWGVGYFFKLNQEDKAV